MQERKETLRRQLKLQRQAMTVNEVSFLSRRIVRRAFSTIDWSKVVSLHVYQPLYGLCEVDTVPFIELVSERHPHIKIATWAKEKDTFTAHWLDENIPVSSDHKFDLIVVPLLGFNSSHHRLGLGGGFYDRYLPTQPDATTIGLCYAAGFTSANFQEAHDVPLQQIFTEDNAYENQAVPS